MPGNTAGTDPFNPDEAFSIERFKIDLTSMLVDQLSEPTVEDFTAEFHRRNGTIGVSNFPGLLEVTTDSETAAGSEAGSDELPVSLAAKIDAARTAKLKALQELPDDEFRSAWRLAVQLEQAAKANLKNLDDKTDYYPEKLHADIKSPYDYRHKEIVNKYPEKEIREYTLNSRIPEEHGFNLELTRPKSEQYPFDTPLLNDERIGFGDHLRWVDEMMQPQTDTGEPKAGPEQTPSPEQ